MDSNDKDDLKNSLVNRKIYALAKKIEDIKLSRNTLPLIKERAIILLGQENNIDIDMKRINEATDIEAYLRELKIEP